MSGLGSLVVRGARLLDAPEPLDVAIDGGVIVGVGAVAAVDGPEELDAGGGLLTPAFVEPHFHADKALTFPRGGSLDMISTEAARERTARVKADATQADVEQRATAAIELAIAHGVGTLRTQIDVDTTWGLRGLEALLAVRDRFAGRIDIQIVAFPQEGIVRDPGAEEVLRAALARGADLLGGAPDLEETPAARGEHIDRVLAIAGELDVDLDIHLDFSYDPRQRDLELLARKTLAAGREGRVTAAHCCAIEAYPADVASDVIGVVRRAGIQVCICPMGNLQLVGEGPRPPGRGVGRVKDLLAGGVNVAAGSDNLHDTWFRFGRMDPAQVALVTALTGRMRTDAEIRTAFDMVTLRAARYVSAPAGGVREGAPADLVLFSAERLEDVLRGAPGRRTTIKRGRVVGGAESHTWLKA
jgi:cytosine/creatinine deaminase